MNPSTALLFALGLVLLVVVATRLATMAIPLRTWWARLVWNAEAIGLVLTALGGVCAMLGLSGHAIAFTAGGLTLLLAVLASRADP